MNENIVISVKGLKKVFEDGVTVLNGIDLDIKQVSTFTLSSVVTTGSM